MSAKYIIRLDDACPTMNRSKWNKIEVLLDKYNIKPIVAVIPNNKDTKQIHDIEDMFFWDKVKNWQKKGWYIALHGYDHVYISSSSGLVPFNSKSEFSGVDYAIQAKKIENGIKILTEKRIFTNIWVAPSHTFDNNTLIALTEKTNINIISDGIGIFPFKKNNFLWIPQQFWRFRKMPIGIWTSCFHPSIISEKEYINLEKFIQNNHQNFIDIKDLDYRRFCILNNIFSFIYWKIRKIKQWF